MLKYLECHEVRRERRERGEGEKGGERGRVRTGEWRKCGEMLTGEAK